VSLLRRFAFPAASFLAVITAAAIHAQGNEVLANGQVLDPSGQPVANAAVTFFSRSGPASYRTATDGAGHFSVVVPRGAYLVQSETAGLQIDRAEQSVTVESASELSLHLSVQRVNSSIEVTATGTPQSLDESAKAVDVVSRAEIDQRGIETITDAIREVPGLRISQRGGPGFFTTIQVRGLRTFDTDVLIDGMRFRDVGATQGDASSFIADLLMVDTDRVEVLRGAGSSIYGTNAIGGVVNIVTDAGSRTFHGSLTADGGGLGEYRGLMRLGGGLRNRLHYSAGAGRQEVTDGVGGYGRYHNLTGNGVIDYTIKPGLVISGRVLATDVYAQLYQSPAAVPATSLPASGYIPAAGLNSSSITLAEQKLPYTLDGATFVPALGDPDYFRTARYVSTMLRLQHQVSAPLSYSVSYQEMPSWRGVVNGPLGPGFQSTFRTLNEFNGRIETVRAQAVYLAGQRQLLSGAFEFERELFDSPSSDNNPNLALRLNSRTSVSESSHSFDAQDQIRLFRDRLQISLSGRIQHFNLSQPVFSGTVPVYASASSISPPNAYTADVSMAYFIRESGTKIRAHGGNGYRKPSLYESFGTSFFGASFTAYGDPRLRPERSISIDGGVDQYFSSDRIRLSATYFYARLQQVIAFDSTGLIVPATDPFGRNQGYRNTGGAMSRGAEVSAEARPLRATTVRTSYTYTNARDRFPQFADGTLQIPRTTPHSVSLVVLQQVSKHVDASAEFVASSDYLYQLSRRTFVFPGPRALALSVGYTRPLSERVRLRLFGRVNNALDQTYYEDAFRTPGRWAVGGITLSY
jgi:iron complex outermembrane receptor protein